MSLFRQFDSHALSTPPRIFLHLPSTSEWAKTPPVVCVQSFLLSPRLLLLLVLLLLCLGVGLTVWSRLSPPGVNPDDNSQSNPVSYLPPLSSSLSLSLSLPPFIPIPLSLPFFLPSSHYLSLSLPPSIPLSPLFLPLAFPLFSSSLFPLFQWP